MNYSADGRLEITTIAIPRIVTDVNCPPRCYLTVEIATSPSIAGVLADNRQCRWGSLSERYSSLSASSQLNADGESRGLNTDSNSYVSTAIHIPTWQLKLLDTSATSTQVSSTSETLSLDDGHRSSIVKEERDSDDDSKILTASTQEVFCFANIVPGV